MFGVPEQIHIYYALYQQILDINQSIVTLVGGKKLYPGAIV